MRKIKIASLQLKVYEDKYENIEKLAELVADGAACGADIISLPEIWNSPYQTDLFPVNAEPEKGDSWLAMAPYLNLGKTAISTIPAMCLTGMADR